MFLETEISRVFRRCATVYDFISEHGTVSGSELTELLNTKLNGVFFAYCQYTTSIACEKYVGTVSDPAHLLEIRLFNTECELRAVRANIGKDFIWRIIDDNKFKEALSSNGESFDERTYTETQFLDIDSTKTEGTNYQFTGGGNYTLPIENAEKIEIRSYGVYDDNGLFVLVDFRIVRIIAKGEE